MSRPHPHPPEHPLHGFRGRLLAGFAALALLAPGAAWATTFTINSESDLRSALTTAQNGDTINFNANVTLITGDLPIVQKNVTILGNNFTLSGNNQFRGLFVAAFQPGTSIPAQVTVAIQDLTIANAKAQGGNGGDGGGGGGAGLGGALFVAAAAQVTASNLQLGSNNATGGNGGAGSGFGGGGGMGGSGGDGGGGLGSGATGGDGGFHGSSGGAGIAPGAAPGGSGGVAGSDGGFGGGAAGGGGGSLDGGGGVSGGAGACFSAPLGGGFCRAGRGGFGGGGGSQSGAGGFGGGGGDGSIFVSTAGGFIGLGGVGGFGGGGGAGRGGGAGGFGGGVGGTKGPRGAINLNLGGGGGGAGLGGAVFVMEGGSLTMAGSLTVNGNTVAPGLGQLDAGNGQAFGSGFFLQGNGTLVFAPAAGRTQTISDIIADQSGNGGAVADGTDGSWALTKSGAGTLLLGNAGNSFTGGVSVTGGTLSIAADGALGIGGALALGNGVTLALTASGTYSHALTVAGDPTITVVAGQSTSWSGSIVDGPSAGSLVVGGGGILALTNAANSYSGGTFVIGGSTLAVDTDAELGAASGGLALGDAATSGKLVLSNSGAFLSTRAVILGAGGGSIDTEGAAPATLSGLISGPGGLTKLGPGILTLTGANTYAGGTTISGGTLQGNTTSLQGNIVDNAALVFDQPTTGTFAGSITGTGSLIKLGPGILALTGSGSYTGATTVSGGTLQAGAANAFSNASAFTVAATLDLNGFTQTIGGLSGAGRVTLGNGTLTTGGDNSSTTFSGVVSGTGGLVKMGIGKFTLTGANTYTGGTTISGGTLQGNTTSLQGNILNNAALVFDQPATGTFAGSITGTGTLVKQNSGLLVLAGNSSAFSGATSINGGILAVGDANNPAASLGGDVAVGPAGTLAGYGTIGGSVSNMSGVVAPGGSIGTLTVGGNFTQGSAGTLAVEVSPAGASQLVVGGKASLAGTLALVYDPGTYSAKTYTLVQAASVSGSFSTVTGQVPTPGLTQSVTIDPTDVQLILGGVVAATNDTIFPAMTSALILNGQQANVMVLDRLGSRLGAPSANTPPTASLAAPASPQTAPAGSSNLAAVSEIAATLPAAIAQYGGWFRGIGSFASFNGNATAPGFGANSGGFLVGFDRAVESDLYLGAAAGYLHSGVQEHSTSSGDTDTGRFMVYGGGWAGPALWTTTAGYAHDGINTTRGFAGVGSAKEAHGGDELTLAAQGSLPMVVNGATVTPKAGVPFLHLHESAFSETGANGLDLSSGARSTDSLQPYVALSVAQTFGTAEETQLTPELRLGYSREVLSNSRVLTVGTLDATNFLVQGVNPSKNMLTAGVGVTVRARDDLFLYANYDALVRTGNTAAQTVSAGLRIRF